MVGQPEVRIISGPQEWMLTELMPSVVPSASVVVAVEDARSRNVLMDGRRVRLSSGPIGLMSIDLTRSTGYHRLVVDGCVFWFGTEDAKLRLKGVTAMLAQLRDLGTGWTGQALFSDGTGVRDAHVLYAWLDQWADLALDAIEAILNTPKPVTTTTRALSRRGGSGVLVPATLRLLRSDPTRHTLPSPDGLLELAGQRYNPTRVVVRRRTRTLDSFANRRAVTVLNWLLRLTNEVLVSDPPIPVVTRCRLWRNRAETLQRRPLAQALTGKRTPPGLHRQTEELTDRHYSATYEVERDLTRLFGWSADVSLQPRYSYIRQADEIYQAYVASSLAAALGLRQTAPALGTEPVAFTSNEYDLYYDTTPPPGILRSWRHMSSRPDSSRPDLLLHEKATDRVALLDAKYRVDRQGGASEDSRKDVTAYLSLYGVSSISIVYPGSAQITQVEGHGRRIVEIPLRPPGDLSSAVPVVLSTFERPSF